MTLYRSRPQLVEAVQWTGDNYEEVRAFCGEKTHLANERLFLIAGKGGAQEWVPVPVDHWIVSPPDDRSDMWPVENEYFIEKYEFWLRK